MEAGRVTTASPGAPSARRRRCSCSWPTARRCRWPASFAVSLLVAVAGCKKPATRLERIDAALAAGGRFLAAQVGADGAIRSERYPYFKDGYSLTPLALAAMFGVVGEPAVDAA